MRIISREKLVAEKKDKLFLKELIYVFFCQRKGRAGRGGEGKAVGTLKCTAQTTQNIID